MKEGYIILPRAIKRQNWYHKPACRLVALHLLLNCTYKATDNVEVGSFRTTIRSLASEIGISHQECRTAIATLEASGFLDAWTEQGKGVNMVVKWQEFTSMRDGNIMLNNTVANTVANTVTACANGGNSNNYNSEKKIPTQLPTQLPTHINNKDNNNTHTQEYNNLVETKSAREAHTHIREEMADVSEMTEWIARYTPDFLKMEIPLSTARIKQMLQEYNVEDIRRLLAVAWSKGACTRHRSAWQAFKSFARNDHQLHKEVHTERLYTYDEVCDYIAKYRVRQEDTFQLVPQVSGLPKWRKKI